MCYVIKFLVDDVINLRIYPGSMADSEKKRGKTENAKTREQKKESFLDEIKNIFHSF